MKILIEAELLRCRPLGQCRVFIVTEPETHRVAADSKVFGSVTALQVYISERFGYDPTLWHGGADKADPIDSPAHYNAGGLKFDGDKPRMDLLDPEALDELAKVLTFGAKKYCDENWRKGISYRRLLAAALRHVFAFMRGEDNDPETGLSHMAHAMCCAMFVIWMQKHRADMDDRYRNAIQPPAES
jgi:hypothetical protein